MRRGGLIESCDMRALVATTATGSGMVLDSVRSVAAGVAVVLLAAVLLLRVVRRAMRSRVSTTTTREQTREPVAALFLHQIAPHQ